MLLALNVVVSMMGGGWGVSQFCGGRGGSYVYSVKDPVPPLPVASRNAWAAPDSRGRRRRRRKMKKGKREREGKREKRSRKRKMGQSGWRSDGILPVLG